MALDNRQILSRALLLGIVVAAIGLSACGRKGGLEPPPGAGAVSDVTADTDAERAREQKPDRPFILDGLL